MCVAGCRQVERGHPTPHHKEQRIARPQHTPPLARLEDALTVLFCLVDDDAYPAPNPRGARCYEDLKRLSDSGVVTLTLFQEHT